MSIDFGPAFFWCLTMFLSVFISFLSWQASRVFHDYRNTRYLQKAQRSIVDYQWRPMAERKPGRVRTPAPEVVLARLRRPPHAPLPVPDEQPGWRQLVAAE